MALRVGDLLCTLHGSIIFMLSISAGNTSGVRGGIKPKKKLLLIFLVKSFGPKKVTDRNDPVNFHNFPKQTGNLIQRKPAKQRKAKKKYLIQSITEVRPKSVSDP